MSVIAALWLWRGVAVYLAVGLVFALVCVSGGVRRFDPDTRDHLTLGTRLILLPGLTLLWPVLLPRLARGGEPPLT